MKKYLALLLLGLFLISFASAFNFETGGVKIIDPIDSVSGGVEVSIQDQTSRPFDVRMFQTVNPNITISEQTTIGSYDVNLTSGHGLIVGDQFSIIQDNGIQQILFGVVLGVNGDTITMDTPVPYNFTVAESLAFESIEEMRVDGSTTPQVFSVENPFSESADITRMMFHITDNSAMDDALFGGINSLTRGIVLRKRLLNGDYVNIVNIKNNGQFGEVAFDKNYDPKAPSGVFGLTVRLTFAGQDKHGVAIRIKQGEAIEVVVQDDLTGLVSFTTMVEGHFTTS